MMKEEKPSKKKVYIRYAKKQQEPHKNTNIIQYLKTIKKHSNPNGR